ncbi:Golgi membrane exchange factor (Ric1p-Rgp1p) subunit [Lithohypha guttulata]|nr:Golgi membrane exchange factor (Ric1p-Rgp1p) subunit [Lithohypha guttulata]
MPSDVQVFVRFKEQCVFAGELIECVITFTNVAENAEPPTPGAGGYRHTKRNSINQLAAAQAAALNTRLAPGGRLHNARSPSAVREERPRVKHQNSYSMSMPSTPIPRGPSPSIEVQSTTAKESQQHHRSVSIISGAPPTLPLSPNDAIATRPKLGGHRRSSTVTIAENTKNAYLPDRQSSLEWRASRSAGRRSPLSASHSPSDPEREPNPDFKFPAGRSSPQPDHFRTAPPSAMPKVKHRRDISTASRATDRTSMDLYSYSNHSGETLMSEQFPMVSERQTARSRVPSELIRQHYKMGPPPPRKPQATTLLMGYAQITSTFTLDASLVDQTPFEEVKRRGFLGGQSGGGVVGVKKKTRPSSGLFGGFNFASIGESLESIIGGESSGVKEMKAVTNSRAIPLLSTPQSLLFVDLHLEPGDEKSFSFSFRLPRGLPASHRGKAIKIVYNMTIGIQGAPGVQQQVSDVRQVSVPFRVFPGVDGDGEILGHDLMQPHVILKDLAMTRQVDDDEQEYAIKQPTTNEIDASNTKFLEFVDSLLDRNRRRQSSSSIMMESLKSAAGNIGSTQNEMLKAIDHAIMTSNHIGVASDTSTSPNRFEIASGGRRIAVVTIDRPLHRLGEEVNVVVDLSNSEVVCSSLRATLETCERVDPSLAVRSAATITRVTRKIYVSRAENVLLAQRSVFAPTIPVSGSPTFMTTGVSLDWYIKLEFGTVRSHEEVEAQQDDSNPATNIKPSLLENILEDERGIVSVAVESLDCDTFEVSIPITVYGDVVQDGSINTNDIHGVPI